MHNWSTNTIELKKDQKKYAIWRIEQLVNFGLGNKKLSRQQLIEFWPKLKIDENKKRFLKLLLWPNQS